MTCGFPHIPFFACAPLASIADTCDNACMPRLQPLPNIAHEVRRSTKDVSRLYYEREDRMETLHRRFYEAMAIYGIVPIKQAVHPANAKIAEGTEPYNAMAAELQQLVAEHGNRALQAMHDAAQSIVSDTFTKGMGEFWSEYHLGR